MALHVLLPLGADASLLRWAALLLTYCLHAASWTLLAALLARHRTMVASMQNLAWKLALLGPVATTLLSVVTAHTAASQLTRVQAPSPGILMHLSPGADASRLFALACIAAVAAGLLRFGAAAARLTYMLRGRRVVRDLRLNRRFERLRERTGIRRAKLSESPHVSGPLVVGRSEICVPSHDFNAYSDAELDAIFAHELAHLERNDGLWFPLVGLIEAVLWMQPLNRLVSTRYRRSAELACDDRAIELTGAPMELARAITRMAEALLPLRGRMLLPTMASVGTPLERVQRLVVASHAPTALEQRRHYGALACLAAVGVVVAMAVVNPTLHVDTVPAIASYDDAMSELAAQEQQLEARRAKAAERAGSDREKAVELLELQQALNHLHGMQTWTEQRFVNAHP